MFGRPMRRSVFSKRSAAPVAKAPVTMRSLSGSVGVAPQQRAIAQPSAAPTDQERSAAQQLMAQQQAPVAALQQQPDLQQLAAARTQAAGNDRAQQIAAKKQALLQQREAIRQQRAVARQQAAAQKQAAAQQRAAAQQQSVAQPSAPRTNPFTNRVGIRNTAQQPMAKGGVVSNSGVGASMKAHNVFGTKKMSSGSVKKVK